MYRALSLLVTRFHASAGEISPLFSYITSAHSCLFLSLSPLSPYPFCRRIISFRRCDPWKSNTLAPVAATARSTRQLHVRSTRLWKSLRRWLITTVVSPWCFQRVHFSPRSLFKADSEISLFHTLPAITRKIVSGYTPRGAARCDATRHRNSRSNISSALLLPLVRVTLLKQWYIRGSILSTTYAVKV